MKYLNPFDNCDFSTYTSKTFGESIKKRRIQLDITAREIARKIGMSPVYLCDLEHGNRPAPPRLSSENDYILKLEKELQLTESQKEIFALMAEFSRLKEKNLIDNYFINHPNSLKFLLKAIENNMTDNAWKELFRSLYEENYE